jgi:hypothetical protein
MENNESCGAGRRCAYERRALTLGTGGCRVEPTT